jgi:hypothetical protein
MITFDTNVLARYYIADKADGFAPQEVARVFHHLLGLPHVTVEDRETLSQALARCEAGLDMADALTMPVIAAARAWPRLTTRNSPTVSSGWA